MIAERTWFVSDGRDEPWRVVVTPDGEAWRVDVERDGESASFRIAPGPGAGRAWVGDRPVRFDWEPGDDGRGRLSLGGVDHRLEVASEAEHRLASLGIGAAAHGQAREIRAPMPGLILVLEVEEGDRVKTGAGIAIVEAMKMENEVTAPIAGIVRDVSVEPGRAVEQGALLCRVEPAGEEEA